MCWDRLHFEQLVFSPLALPPKNIPGCLVPDRGFRHTRSKLFPSTNGEAGQKLSESNCSWRRPSVFLSHSDCSPVSSTFLIDMGEC